MPVEEAESHAHICAADVDLLDVSERLTIDDAAGRTVLAVEHLDVDGRGVRQHQRREARRVRADRGQLRGADQRVCGGATGGERVRGGS